MATLTYEVDPISRIEGHLGVKVTTDDGLTQVSAGMGKYTYLNDGAWKLWSRGALDIGAYNFYEPAGDPTTWATLPTATGAVSIAAGSSGLTNTPSGSMSVIKDGSTFRMYIGKADFGSGANSIACCTSTDGFTFTCVGSFAAPPAWAGGAVDAPSVMKDGATYKLLAPSVMRRPLMASCGPTAARPFSQRPAQ
jgi:hypothetical protein